MMYYEPRTWHRATSEYVERRSISLLDQTSVGKIQWTVTFQQQEEEEYKVVWTPSPKVNKYKNE